MSIKIKIGADELILWLRKNQKAINIPNDETQGLGRKIHDLIVNDFNGSKVVSNHPSYWAHLIGDQNVQKLNLPKKSAQYEIESDKMGDLYEILFSW